MEELLSKFATKAAIKALEIKMKEMEKRLDNKIDLVAAQTVKQMMVWTIAVQGLGVAILVLILK